MRCRWARYYLAHDSQGPTKGRWWEHVVPTSAFTIVKEEEEPLSQMAWARRASSAETPGSAAASPSMMRQPDLQPASAGWAWQRHDTDVQVAPGCPLLAYLHYARLRALMLPVRPRADWELACKSVAAAVVAAMAAPGEELGSSRRGEDAGQASVRSRIAHALLRADPAPLLAPDLLELPQPAPDDWHNVNIPADATPIPALVVNLPRQQPAAQPLHPGLEVVQESYKAHACIKYTPLGGLQPDDLVAGLLEFDGCKILLDCGWDESFSLEAVQHLRDIAPQVDAVLLSHQDLQHVGALPYLIAHCGLSAPILGTLPVQRMGSLALQELVSAKKASSDFSLFEVGDVVDAFSSNRWTLLRYYQQYLLPGAGPDQAIQVTPYNSGRLVGGAVWRLVSQSGEEVVYAVDWCHRRERHLAACSLADLFTQRPALLIADAMDGLAPSVDSSRRDVEFLDCVLATLRGADGSVLLPTDCAGRALELALLLDEFWAREKYDRVYPLVWVSETCRAVADAAQSQLEWMADSVGKQQQQQQQQQHEEQQQQQHEEQQQQQHEEQQQQQHEEQQQQQHEEQQQQHEEQQQQQHEKQQQQQHEKQQQQQHEKQQQQQHEEQQQQQHEEQQQQKQKQHEEQQQQQQQEDQKQHEKQQQQKQQQPKGDQKQHAKQQK
ncbi:hypothetical protein QJQ45_018676, partial [Haematococcus lacustris]